MFRTKTNKIHGFWKYIADNITSLNDIKSTGIDTLENIIKKLKAVNNLLVVEIGLKEDSKENNQLVISADGNLAAFSDVLSIVRLAPCINGWEIKAFRQKRDIKNIKLRLANVVLSADKISFTYFKDLYKSTDLINLNVYVSDVNELTDDIKNGVFLFLDSSVGEFNVGTRVGRVGMGLISEYQAHPIESPIMPLTELDKVISRA